MSKTENKPFISVIIPSYNEEKNLAGGTLDKIVRYLNEQSYFWEIIIVDDGSTTGDHKTNQSYVWHVPLGRLVWSNLSSFTLFVILYNSHSFIKSSTQDYQNHLETTPLDILLPWLMTVLPWTVYSILDHLNNHIADSHNKAINIKVDVFYAA